VHDVAILIVNSGLRLMEALTLRWDEIDLTGGMFEGGTLYVKSKQENPIKDREERVLPINDAIRALLLRRRQVVPRECPWVFPTRGGRSADRGTFRRDLSLAAQRAGISPSGKVSAQALRRFFATVNARTGMPPFVLRGLMGHSSVRTTEQHYIAGGAGPGWTPRSFGLQAEKSA
jgi:integrase